MPDHVWGENNALLVVLNLLLNRKQLYRQCKKNRFYNFFQQVQLNYRTALGRNSQNSNFAFRVQFLFSDSVYSKDRWNKTFQKKLLEHIFYITPYFLQKNFFLKFQNLVFENPIGLRPA